MGLVAWGSGFTEPFLRRQIPEGDSPMLIMLNLLAENPYTYDEDWEIASGFYNNQDAVNTYCSRASINYALMMLRGQQFYSFYTLGTDDANNPNPMFATNDGTDTTSYFADKIGPWAYATSLRIRNINISEAQELAFGIEDATRQPISSAKSYLGLLDENGDNLVGVSYVRPYFPIHSTPDSGWGSCTMEIISYQGIAMVVNNDYEGFCRWHRGVMYLLNVQNAGFLNNWDSNASLNNNSIPAETIDRTTQQQGWMDTAVPHLSFSDLPNYASTEADPNKLGWLPSYLDKDGAGQYAINDIPNQWALDSGNTSNFTIYTWPPDAPQDTPSNTTKYWSNRLFPYNGAGIAWRTGWTLPSWCIGFKPVWVAGGVNNDFTTEYVTVDSSGNSTTTTVSENSSYPSINGYDKRQPLFQALNPYFAAQDGLYTASDADMNMYIAYKLADLAWGNNTPTGSPDATGFNLNGKSGWDCDVADFEGVGEANTAFNSNLIDNDTESKMTVSKAIGYGWDFEDDGKLYTDETYSGSGTPYRMFTWKNISIAMARTLNSRNGLADYNVVPSPYGNFTNYNKLKEWIITLGHDTNESSIKPDYIDLAVMMLARENGGGFDTTIS